jgi:hypothetical protein
MVNLREKFKYYFKKLLQKINSDQQKALVSLGRIHVELNKNKKAKNSLGEVEFQVFSQRGEDGIIQYLINNIEIPNKIFIEFGVENYLESNTRFLMINNNWSGLVIDGSKDNIKFIKSDDVYWKYDLTAVHSFIKRDNINKIIKSFTSIEDVGLLSIDIDGNDYWIWEEINVISPRIVICEYNSSFGPEKTVSVPYDPNFRRSDAHYSDLYFGASLNAFCYLADKKGYDFVGTAEAGVNAFFVRKDLSNPFKKFNSKDGFRASPNRDSRDKNGNLSFLPHKLRLNEIKELNVTDVTNGEIRAIKDIYSHDSQ